MRKDLIQFKAELSEFANAYEMLCDALYEVGAYRYKEIMVKDSEKEDEEIEDGLMDIKKKADDLRADIRGRTRGIYKGLKIKYGG